MNQETERLKYLQKKFGILGQTTQVRSMLETIDQVAPTDISVLISGDSGTGKELVASALHSHSKRARNNFVIVNCGAIPAGIIESELFGHKKGAFTGANEDRKGYFQTADHGTIFLDEIGETPLETQVKLLRVLEQGEFMPVGGSKVIKVDVRIIAASNRNLADEVAKESFRMDLYYRLKAITINVPSLNERKEDISELANLFARQCALRNDILFKGFSDSAYQVMADYEWPGNIRELKNFVESIVVLEKGAVVKSDMVRRHLYGANPTSTPTMNYNLPVPTGKDVGQAERELMLQQLYHVRRELAELRGIIEENLTRVEQNDVRMRNLDITSNAIHDVSDMEEVNIINPYTVGEITASQVEKELLIKTLKRYGFNKRKTAKSLDIAERTLYRKIKEYGIKQDES